MRHNSPGKLISSTNRDFSTERKLIGLGFRCRQDRHLRRICLFLLIALLVSLAIQRWRGGGMKPCPEVVSSFLALSVRLMKDMHDTCLDWGKYASLLAENLLRYYRMRGGLVGFSGKEDDGRPLLCLDMRGDCVNFRTAALELGDSG
jgi:hypothetical protein